MNRKIIFIFCLLAVSLFASAKRVGVYCYFANGESHLYEDENVKMVLAAENNWLSLTAYNKTNNKIFIDMADSYTYTNGKALSLIKNLNTSNGDASSVVALAPRSSQVLYVWEKPQESFRTDMMQLPKWSGDCSRGRFLDVETRKKVKFNKGIFRNYTESNTLLSVSALVKYAVDENLYSAKQVMLSNHITDVLIDGYKGVKDPSYPLYYCTELKERRADYSFVSGKGWAATPLGLTAIITSSILAIELIVLASLGYF